MAKKTAVRKKNPHAVAMVKRRNAGLTPEERSAIASTAARARWGRKKAKGKAAA